ncbi:MAG: Ribonuclease P protein component [Mycoplasmataceae bacterium]|nr:MAG: Ribonuclease P protein component [Mycoplasmataceae bacterium]
MVLWKPYRLRKNWQFQEIITDGQKIVNASFVIFLVSNKLDNCQFGISTPKKLVKKAVGRNKYKRQIRDMLIKYLKKNQDSCQINDNHKHYDFVIIIRHSYLENDFQTNQKNLYKLMELAHRKIIESSFFPNQKK